MGVSYDYIINPGMMNILTPVGKKMAPLAVLTLVTSGLVCGGPVCTPWIWICRKETGRSAKRPQGPRRKIKVVKEGNDMCAFVCALTRIAYLRGLNWWWEQPVSSLFFRMKCWVDFVEWVQEKFNRTPQWVTFPLTAYGGTWKKPTKMMGDWKLMQKLGRKMKDGKKAKDALYIKTDTGVRGKEKQLKASESYPAGLGTAVANLLLQTLTDEHPTCLENTCYYIPFWLIHKDIVLKGRVAAGVAGLFRKVKNLDDLVNDTISNKRPPSDDGEREDPRVTSRLGSV